MFHEQCFTQSSETEHTVLLLFTVQKTCHNTPISYINMKLPACVLSFLHRTARPTEEWNVSRVQCKKNLSCYDEMSVIDNSVVSDYPAYTQHLHNIPYILKF